MAMVRAASQRGIRRFICSITVVRPSQAKASLATQRDDRRFFCGGETPPPPPPPLHKFARAVALKAAAEASPLPSSKPSTTLFISGLAQRTNTERITSVFSPWGTIRSAMVVNDFRDWYCLGFGYVRYASLEEAAEAIENMDGLVLDGSKITVQYDKQRSPSELRSSVVPWRWTEEFEKENLDNYGY